MGMTGAAAGTRQELALVCTGALLLAIWPLPGTIVLRNWALLAGLVLGALEAWRQMRGGIDLRRYWPLGVLLAFFPWLLWHVLAWPTLPQEQWYDLRGDWLRALCASVTGLGLGLVLARHPQRDAATVRRYDRILLLGLSGTVLIYAARYLWEVWQTGVLLHREFFEHPYAGKTATVVFGGLFLVALAVHLLQALHAARPGRTALASAAAIVLVLANFYLANTKNGFIVFLACSALFLLGLLRTRPASLRIGLRGAVLAFLAALMVLGALAMQWRSNPAWSNMQANVQLCADIDHQEFWKDQNAHPLPVLPSGQPVDISTCQRVAWGHAGLRLIAANPGGYGLIHHSFGALAIQHWEGFIKPVGKSRGATHSGLIDFTLGFGVFGLALVLLPLLVAFHRVRRADGFWQRFTRWAVPVLLLIYLVTEVCTGHFLELLFFLAAWFSALAATEQGTQPATQAA